VERAIHGEDIGRMSPRITVRPKLLPLLLGGALAASALAGRRGSTGRQTRVAEERWQAEETRLNGRLENSPQTVSHRGWLAVLQQVGTKVGRNNMPIVAAGCGFYAMLALFPAITALVSIYGLIADPQQVEDQVSAMRGVLPEAAASLIAAQATAVASGTSGILGWSAALAILFALWTASSGVKALFTALNIAYEEEEKRGVLQFNITALLFTFLMIVGVTLGLGVIVVLPAVLQYLPLGQLGGWAARIGSWAVLLGLLLLGLAAIYRFGPSRAEPRWRWVTPGSLLAALLLLAASAGFSIYVANFASYNETYGALGGVIILLIWLYLSAFVVLLGAELNAELEPRSKRDTSSELPRPIGQRHGYAGDHVAQQAARASREVLGQVLSR
jgi:membrane protein